MNNKIKKFQGGNVLPEITVVPNKLFLYTYYPLINSRYPFTGHSELRVSSPNYYRDTENGYVESVDGISAHIDKKMEDSGYNLVTNNCADATRCALEAILGKKMNPYFFTTPGDVLDFFKENFDTRKVKGKRKGQETWYTNITPLLAEVIKNQLYKLIQENKKARKWKHQNGGTITAGKLAKKHLTLRKNPDWDNLDRGYRYLTQDMGMDHNRAIALMGNIVEESYGNYLAVQKNGGGRGLIQWDGRPAPKGRYAQWKAVWESVAKRANRYNPETKVTENYWKKINGVNGEQLRQLFNNQNTPISRKVLIYSESYLRPGKPRMNDRKLSAALLDSIYNPNIKNIIIRLKKNGGSMRIPGVCDSNPNLDNMKGDYVSKKKLLKKKKHGK